jgi:hypothetical protein
VEEFEFKFNQNDVNTILQALSNMLVPVKDAKIVMRVMEKIDQQYIAQRKV